MKHFWNPKGVKNHARVPWPYQGTLGFRAFITNSARFGVLSSPPRHIRPSALVPSLGTGAGAPLSWGDILVKNLIPVTIGNAIAGAFAGTS